jgi:hypothetical protein
MFDDEALVWPGMKDARFGEPVVRQFRHPLPRRAIFLAAPLERAPPEVENVMAEGHECATVGRNRMIVEEAGDDLLEPFAMVGNVCMHAPAQLLLDLLQLCPHAVAAALPPDEEFAVAGSTADEGEAEEVEGLRFSEPAFLTPFRCEAAERDQAGLLRVKRECELL